MTKNEFRKKLEKIGYRNIRYSGKKGCFFAEYFNGVSLSNTQKFYPPYERHFQRSK